MLPIEGDALPAAIDGHASGDGERVAEDNIAAATEGDGIAIVIAVGCADIGLQLAVIATIANGQSGRRVGFAAAQGRACQQAKAQQETEREQAQPGREACRSWVHKRTSFLAASLRRRIPSVDDLDRPQACPPERDPLQFSANEGFAFFISGIGFK